MKTYELTYIVSSSAGQEDLATIAKEIQSAIQAKQGVILTSEKSHAVPLAYPIKKQRSGIYVTEIFQIAEGEVKGLGEVATHNANILRHFLAVKKAPKIMKERRTRKPAFAEVETKAAFPTDDKKSGPVDSADLDKKLGEIVGE